MPGKMRRFGPRFGTNKRDPHAHQRGYAPFNLATDVVRKGKKPSIKSVMIGAQAISAAVRKAKGVGQPSLPSFSKAMALLGEDVPKPLAQQAEERDAVLVAAEKAVPGAVAQYIICEQNGGALVSAKFKGKTVTICVEIESQRVLWVEK